LKGDATTIAHPLEARGADRPSTARSSPVRPQRRPPRPALAANVTHLRGTPEVDRSAPAATGDTAAGGWAVLDANGGLLRAADTRRFRPRESLIGQTRFHRAASRSTHRGPAELRGDSSPRERSKARRGSPGEHTFFLWTRTDPFEGRVSDFKPLASLQHTIHPSRSGSSRSEAWKFHDPRGSAPGGRLCPAPPLQTSFSSRPTADDVLIDLFDRTRAPARMSSGAVGARVINQRRVGTRGRPASLSYPLRRRGGGRESHRLSRTTIVPPHAFRGRARPKRHSCSTRILHAGRDSRCPNNNHFSNHAGPRRPRHRGGRGGRGRGEPGNCGGAPAVHYSFLSRGNIELAGGA